MTSTRPITLVIERLVLDGFELEPHQIDQLRSSVVARLQDLLAEAGSASLEHLGNAPSVNALDVGLRTDAPGDAIGRLIASSVHAGLTAGSAGR